MKEQLALNNLDYKKLETTHLSVVKEFKAYREAVMGIDITYMIEILGGDYEVIVNRIKRDILGLSGEARKTLIEYLNIHKIGLLHEYSMNTGTQEVEWHKIGAISFIHSLIKILSGVPNNKPKYDPITRELISHKQTP